MTNFIAIKEDITVRKAARDRLDDVIRQLQQSLLREEALAQEAREASIA